MNINNEIPHFVRNDSFFFIGKGTGFLFRRTAVQKSRLRPLLHAVIPNGVKRNEESHQSGKISNP